MTASAKRRAPGRPSKSAEQDLNLTRRTIIEQAWKLVRTEPLDDISIVRIAKSFNVSTTAIRYHIGSRDALVSAVLNRFFELAAASMPEVSGDWERDLRRTVPVQLGLLLDYAGVATYLNNNNRFRIFQRPSPEGVDYGARYFDRSLRIFRSAGLPPSGAAMAWHLFALIILSSANAEIRGMLPAHHHRHFAGIQPFLNDPEVEAASNVLPEMKQIDIHRSVQAALDLLIFGIKGGQFGRLHSKP